MGKRGKSQTSGSSARKLSVQLIGGIGLSVNGHDLQLSNRKGRALLAFLALEPQMQSRREHLAHLFWGGVSDTNSRTSLRQTLFDIREAFRAARCAPLTDDRDSVGLDREKLEIDIDSLVDQTLHCTVPDALATTERLTERLIAGYEDISLPFDEWLRTARHAIHNRIAAELDRALHNETLSRQKRYKAASAARKLDPLNETACRIFMQLSAEDGETGASLRAYDELYHALGDEMDMEPSERTQALVAQVKLGEFDWIRDDSKSASIGRASGAPTVPAEAAVISPAGPTLAVLPFEDMGPEPVPAYLAQGVVEDTVCMLSSLHEPIVVSHNSTRDYTNVTDTYAGIAERLGVTYLVRGSVRKINTHIRITVQLIDSGSAAIIWAKSYDTSEPHLFDTTDTIVANIARTLVPNLREAELRRCRHQPPENLSAYHLMLRARDLTFRLERASFEEAGDLLSRAVQTDPNYAPTHAAYADWYSVRIGQGWSPDPEDDLRALNSMARLAIHLDMESGRALAILGHNKTILSRDYEAAQSLLERAVDASPNDAETLMWTSPTFAYSGDGTEAVKRAERAIALSPRDPYLFRYEHFLSIAHYAAGAFEEAAEWGLRSMERNPAYTSNLRMTAASLSAVGRGAESNQIVEKLLELQPNFTVSSHLTRQAFRSDSQKKEFGKHLIDAGLPE